jgi:GNAT superfamily N-acetyltransferase
MSQPTAVEFRPVPPFQGPFLTNMTFPAYAGLLHALHRPEVVAVSASLPGAVLGLALGVRHERSAVGEVLSLFVVPEHRRQGLGGALLRRLEEGLAAAGCTRALLEYNTSTPTAPAVQRLVRSHGWSEPRQKSILCKVSGAVLEAPFFREPLFSAIQDCLPSAVVFPWAELTEAEREQLRRGQEAERWIPDDLLPYVHEQGCDLRTSFGMRLDGAVVGWLITHRLSPPVVRYTCWYSRPEVQQQGGNLLLLREAVRAHAAEYPDGHGIFGVAVPRREFTAFVRRRMAPFLLSITEVWESDKALG